MAVNRRPAYNRQTYSGQGYIYGNTVRKPEVVPKRREEVVPKTPKRVSKQVRKNRKSALHMNASYVVFLTIAAVAALFVCVYYLQLRAELTSRSNNITAMQQELADKKEVNNTKLNNAMDSVNLEEVRKKAIEELGMAHATPEQIITYKNQADNYVKKYKEIPKSGVSTQIGSTD